MKEPFAFRGAFLLGGVHYACQAGSLGEFERTMYYHLMQAMRALNRFLSSNKVDSRSRVLCMHLIATMATVEVKLRTQGLRLTCIPWALLTCSKDVSGQLLRGTDSYEWTCRTPDRGLGPRTRGEGRKTGRKGTLAEPDVDIQMVLHVSPFGPLLPV